MKSKKSKIKNQKFNSKSKTFIFLIVILTFTFCLLPLGKSWAQELSVAIDPPILQIEANPPSLVKSPISLTNETNQNVTYSIFLIPFKARANNSGVELDSSIPQEYKIMFDKVQVSDENGPLTQISLAPKQRKDLTLSIRILKEDKARDYYFSVIFISEASQEDNESSSIGARAGIGQNVLLSVGPKSQTEGKIQEFSTSRFVTRGPVKFKLSVANESNHFVEINGNLVIRNVFNQTVGNINFVPANILAQSNRLIDSDDNPNPAEPRIFWNEKFLLGLYKADLSLALSEEGPVLKKTIWFFAFPLEAVLLIILSIIILVGMIKRARRKSQG